ncbi:hypothetical protein DL93DRAFT_2103007 [Clavulina sp. PMI_390]|nr:hypothetical protein DL93DRAFT_2103007 [Clavulina sp. PMI_390]
MSSFRKVSKASVPAPKRLSTAAKPMVLVLSTSQTDRLETIFLIPAAGSSTSCRGGRLGGAAWPAANERVGGLGLITHWPFGLVRTHSLDVEVERGGGSQEGGKSERASEGLMGAGMEWNIPGLIMTMMIPWTGRPASARSTCSADPRRATWACERETVVMEVVTEQNECEKIKVGGGSIPSDEQEASGETHLASSSSEGLVLNGNERSTMDGGNGGAAPGAMLPSSFAGQEHGARQRAHMIRRLPRGVGEAREMPGTSQIDG